MAPEVPMQALMMGGHKMWPGAALGNKVPRSLLSRMAGSYTLALGREHKSQCQ